MKSSHEHRLQREQQHAIDVIETGERNWGWHTPAGRVRLVRRAEYLAAVSSDPDARVLEIGCGTGTFTHALSRKFGGLVAIDISADLLRVARARVPGARFAMMDAHKPGFAPSTFDAIVGCSVLHHLDWRGALANLRPLLKPGGVVRFSEPNLANPQIFLQKKIPALKRWARDSPDESAFTAREATRALEEAGFDYASAKPFEFLHPHVPERAIGIAVRIEARLMASPLRAIAGSILIEGRVSDR